MPKFLDTIVIFSILFAVISGSHGQLLFTSDRTGPISKLLQVVWEPSSLVRMWTALDQFYNVALSWRSAARTVATLPFREGRSMDHVRIKEPRSFKLQHRQMDLPHWDRFNKIYSESAQSLNVANAQETNLDAQLGVLPLLNMAVTPGVHQLPNPSSLNVGYALGVSQFGAPHQNLLLPPLTVRPQEVFSDYNMGNFPQNIDSANVRHPTGLVDSFVQNGGNMINYERPGKASQNGFNVPLMFFNTNGALNSNPETRLRMFLKLMQKLGEKHTKNVNNVQFDDDLNDGV